MYRRETWVIQEVIYHPWQGPWTIASHISDSTYCIQQCGSRKRKVVHFDQLRLVNEEGPEEATEAPKNTPAVPSVQDSHVPARSSTTDPFVNPVKVDCKTDENRSPPQQSPLYSDVVRSPAPPILASRSQRQRHPPVTLNDNFTFR